MCTNTVLLLFHTKISFSRKAKFYIFLKYCYENFFIDIFSCLRPSRTGKNCAHIKIQKKLKKWDTLLQMVTEAIIYKKAHLPVGHVWNERAGVHIFIAACMRERGMEKAALKILCVYTSNDHLCFGP
jgi:hypothetical protein